MNYFSFSSTYHLCNKVFKGKKTFCAMTITKCALDNEENWVVKFNTNTDYKTKILRRVVCPLVHLNIVAKNKRFTVTKYAGMMLLWKCNPEKKLNIPGQWIAYKNIKKHRNLCKITDNGCTKEWAHFKHGTKERSSTSKSDVFLRNDINNKTITISIKSGHGRITSADKYETNAIFSLVYANGNFKDDEYHFLNLINSIKESTKHTSSRTFTAIKELSNYNDDTRKDIDWRDKENKIRCECNNAWANMSTPFRHAIILECLSGRLKFGKGSICGASYLMELSDSKGQEIKNIIYLSHNNQARFNYIESINKSLKQPFNFKSASSKTGRGIWMRFC